MKKVISLLLCLVLVISCGVIAFAEKDCDCGHVPVIVVSGMNSYPMTLDGEEVFPPQIDVGPIVLAALKGLAGSLFTLSWNGLADALIPVANDMLGAVACDANGDSVEDIKVLTFPESAANYDRFTSMTGGSNEHGLIYSSIQRYGADHTYFYNYNWRLDPMDHAVELKAMVDKAIAETGHDKVILIPCSMGGAQVMAYLSLYGSDEIDSIAFLSSVFCGATVASDLFNKRVTIDKGSLLRFISASISDPATATAINYMLKILDLTGVLDLLLSVVQNAVDAIIDPVFDELLTDIFGTMPGLWSLIDEPDYETAKQTMLDPVKHAGLIERIDKFHNNVALKREKLLRDAEQNGTKIIVFSHYNTQNIPVYKTASEQGDGTVDMYGTSGYAYAAKMGETLPADYQQKYKACGHDHISPDRVIDASACIFPEYTWFFKDVPHVYASAGSDQSDLLWKLLEYDGQPTVHTAGFAPQFLRNVGDKKLSPVEN
ncbi:MAG: alpha/beta fold hydrolase [Oscillospiraceae bacterium]|nr:alpha/beta fold hydrolase [Oscillospiraceae bacterium]